MSPILILADIVIFIYGVIIGSFLNVCIFRIPREEDIVKVHSHCMHCGYQLRWYDLIPLFSYIMLGGRCRKCGSKLSIQYPIIEALNGILYVVVFWVNGYHLESILFCLMTSALLVLSVIDFRTYEIPFGINVFLGVLGLIRLVRDYQNWPSYIIGFFAVSVFLFLLQIVSQGRAIGGGDVKLMAACGLLLGWKMIILSFLLGCIIGSVCHMVRMKLTQEGHVLAMGPYLSVGIFISALWGERMLDAYLSLLVS